MSIVCEENTLVKLLILSSNIYIQINNHVNFNYWNSVCGIIIYMAMIKALDNICVCDVYFHATEVSNILWQMHERKCLRFIISSGRLFCDIASRLAVQPRERERKVMFISLIPRIVISNCFNNGNFIQI